MNTDTMAPTAVDNNNTIIVNSNNNAEGGRGGVSAAAAGPMGTQEVVSDASSSLEDAVASDRSEHVVPPPESDLSPPPPPVVIQEEEEVDRSKPTYVSHGCISVSGRRREMDDAVTVAASIGGGDYSFFAVYDGHKGSRVSKACRDRLHVLLENELESLNSADAEGGSVVNGDSTTGIDWEAVMMACFAKMDNEVNATGGDGDYELSVRYSVGSTAVVVLVGKEELVVANCGDSRAVLYSGGVAVPLSVDHKPDRPDELERVEALGGRVINWDDGSRVLGVLATSRSIGHRELKPYVSSEPEVTVHKRTESDSFVIIASDGMWDVLSNEVACGIVRLCLAGRVRRRYDIPEHMRRRYAIPEGACATEAAKMIVELAIGRRSTDNISAIVVELN